MLVPPVELDLKFPKGIKIFWAKKLIVVARRVDIFEKYFPQNTFVETDIADDNSIDNFLKL
ncbi:MAG: hypothetical protein CM15mP58_20420 [Burkholderiaceae bacterium]|nr:MAG: hypothetical protein CM15mP58_20420 [Burkholderiaceae bacterium]